MNSHLALKFAQPEIFEPLMALDAAELGTLEFSVIGKGMGPDTVVRDDNAVESKMAGLSNERVVADPVNQGTHSVFFDRTQVTDRSNLRSSRSRPTAPTTANPLIRRSPLTTARLRS